MEEAVAARMLSQWAHSERGKEILALNRSELAAEGGAWTAGGSLASCLLACPPALMPTCCMQPVSAPKTFTNTPYCTRAMLPCRDVSKEGLPWLAAGHAAPVGEPAASSTPSFAACTALSGSACTPETDTLKGWRTEMDQRNLDRIRT